MKCACSGSIALPTQEATKTNEAAREIERQAVHFSLLFAICQQRLEQTVAQDS